jgi:hypothetical protein
MIVVRGFLEILQMADSNAPRSFNDFTKISISRKRLSSATVSKRIDQFVAAKVMDEVISRSKVGRRIIGYSITEKGKRVILLLEELHRAFAIPVAN